MSGFLTSNQYGYEPQNPEAGHDVEEIRKTTCSEINNVLTSRGSLHLRKKRLLISYVCLAACDSLAATEKQTSHSDNVDNVLTEI